MRERERICARLFVKAFLLWACRLNMKGSLTWRASPEDTPLWTMPGQTWHTAPSLRDGQGPKYVCKRERQGRYICALKQCLVALESKTKGEVTAMCSTDSRSECVYLRVSGRVCMHVCWCVCVCVYTLSSGLLA